MKKLMPFVGAALLVLFTIGVFVIVMSLSYRALGLIFPDDLFDQAIGLLLFDAAAVVWFLVFVYQSHSTMQYVFALFGFGIGLLGTIALVGIEVAISSGMLVVADMIKPLTYIFIAVAVAHVVLLYLRHAAGPEVSSKINLGVEKAKIQDEGMRQAEQQLDIVRSQLGEAIRARLLDEVLRDLDLAPRVIDAKALPLEEDAQSKPNFLGSVWWPWGNGGLKSGTAAKSAGPGSKTATPTRSPAADDAERADGEPSGKKV